MDFGRVWGGFWDGKIVDFPIFFRTFFDAKLRMQLECKKNSKKEVCPPNRAECAVPGGRIIGWGEAYLSLNFKPYLRIDL